MDRSYWEKIAPGYDDEIFDVLQQDKKRIILKTIRKHAGANKTVLDAGCAIGKWLPVLAPLFKKVEAVDISAKNLAIAKKKYPEFNNIEYRRVDLSSERAKLPKADVVLCVNAILTDSLRKRNAFFHNLSKCTNKGGHLILVIPSLESYLLTRIIQHRWKIDEAVLREKLTAKQGLEKYKNVQQGNLDIDSVPTKHYIREELILLLQQAGFAANSFKKIEYDWRTEFNKPPSWLKDPRPWDWMVDARRVDKR